MDSPAPEEGFRFLPRRPLPRGLILCALLSTGVCCWTLWFYVLNRSLLNRDVRLSGGQVASISMYYDDYGVHFSIWKRGGNAGHLVAALYSWTPGEQVDRTKAGISVDPGTSIAVIEYNGAVEKVDLETLSSVP